MISKKKIIRNLKPGDAVTLVLSNESYAAWRQRVLEINKEDGWRHYSVFKNKKLDMLAIVENFKINNYEGIKTYHQAKVLR